MSSFGGKLDQRVQLEESGVQTQNPLEKWDLNALFSYGDLGVRVHVFIHDGQLEVTTDPFRGEHDRYQDIFSQDDEHRWDSLIGFPDAEQREAMRQKMLSCGLPKTVIQVALKYTVWLEGVLRSILPESYALRRSDREVSDNS